MVEVRDGDVAPRTRFVLFKIASVLLVCGGRAFGGENAMHFRNLCLVIGLQLRQRGCLVFALPLVPWPFGCLS